ncbi:MAG TPA: Ig-like domain-containing protein, partial [Isosphaeraceae bacterium]
SGTVQFAAGQTSATVLVPVKHDGLITPNLTFFFLITGVDHGGSLGGGPAAATVTIVNTDRDLTPPLVTGVVPVVSNNSILAYVVDFSKALDPARASNPNNYGLFLSGRDLGTGNAFIPVSASYNPANFSVTLVPTHPVMLNAFYGLMINGGNANGVTDLSGNFLDGAGAGFGGTNYGALIGYGTSLNYFDASNHFVNLGVSGTQMEIVRNFSGNAYELQLFGNNGHAVIAGSVRGGSTSIAEIDGLGPFGSVNANGLTTPPFFVAISNFNAPMPVPQTIATAALVGDTVPNGPAYVLARLKAKAG